MKYLSEIIVGITTLLGTALPFLIVLIAKIKKAIKDKNWAAILKELPNYIIEAEKIVNFKGNDKKEWVLAKIRTYCVDNKICFDSDKFEAEIANIVNLTKNVNARDKDKNRQV